MAHLFNCWCNPECSKFGSNFYWDKHQMSNVTDLCAQMSQCRLWCSESASGQIPFRSKNRSKSQKTSESFACMIMRMYAFCTCYTSGKTDKYLALQIFSLPCFTLFHSSCFACHKTSRSSLLAFFDRSSYICVLMTPCPTCSQWSSRADTTDSFSLCLETVEIIIPLRVRVH